MKKSITLIFALIMAVLMLCSCTPAAAPVTPDSSTPELTAPPAETPAQQPPAFPDQQPAEDSSLQDILSKGKLVLGMDDAFPPMGFRDESNELTGFDLDVATEIGKRMNITIEPIAIDWSQKINELNTGNIDVIWNGFTITDERIRDTEMTFAYMKNRQVIVVLANAEYATLADLNGKVLSLQALSSAEDALNDSPDFKATLKDIILLNTNMDALRDLEVGGCDAVLMDEVVANYYITGGSQYKVLDEYLADEEYGIGFKKGAVTLKNEVEKHLTEMKKDGTLETISTKWFGKDVTTIPN